MADGQLKLQALRTNDLVEDSGKQVEFGAKWNQFFGIPDTEKEVTLKLKFKALRPKDMPLDGKTIELQLSALTNRNDRKVYANGDNGYSQIKDFFINDLQLTVDNVGKDFFALYREGDKDYLLFFIPELLYANFVYLFRSNDLVVTAHQSDAKTTTSDSLQQISYGAPGTGKSHGVKEETKAWEKEGRVVRTTFHPDSDYSTFVGAYKPTTQMMQRYDMYQNPLKDKTTGLPVMEQVITYEFVPQAFLQAYVDAWKDTSNPEYLVIEEINRGNCAQIFGDLFQLLDRDENGYSEYAIRADRDLQKYLAEAFADAEIENENVKSGKELLLPKNLFIRATMNTSDQSLFPIDSAFKRRWDWQYMPISDAGKQWTISVGDTSYEWWDFVSKINNHIFEATNSEDKQLGYFFCKAKDKTISTAVFVGKVIFYLWNDVFKDFGFDDPIFADKEDDVNPKLSFDKFYAPNGKVKVETVKKFMENLGVAVASVAEETEEYEGQEETTRTDDDDKKSWSETETKRYEFWTALLNYGQQNAEFAKYYGGVKKASTDHWKNFFVKGMDFYFVINQLQSKKAIELQVYFDETEDGFHDLLAHKEEIENEMQVQYEWAELPGKKASKIIETKNGVDFDNKESWPEIFEFCLDRLLRMREVFPKYAK